MKRDDVVTEVEAKLKAMGVAAHSFKITKVPAKVEVKVAVGGASITKTFRSGIQPAELDIALGDIESVLNQRRGTKDLEEAIEAAE